MKGRAAMQTPCSAKAICAGRIGAIKLLFAGGFLAEIGCLAQAEY
ncbi:MAG: hypothetical protein K0S36_1572 [Nitrosospira multiformis]|jgi:hypothetical protein|nr:hypothetical protein [Nitrosospira multiformis]